MGRLPNAWINGDSLVPNRFAGKIGKHDGNKINANLSADGARTFRIEFEQHAGASQLVFLKLDLPDQSFSKELGDDAGDRTAV